MEKQEKKPLTTKQIRLIGLALIFLIGPLLAYMQPILGGLVMWAGIFLAIFAKKIVARHGTEEPLADAPRPPASSKFLRQWWTWDSSVHESKGQPIRMQRALTQDITIPELSKKGVAQVKGTKGDSYRTTFQTCSCPDFQERARPCKHMYALAIRYAGFEPVPYILLTDVKSHPLRGYMNMGAYNVTGKNPETNRSKTRRCYAADEAGAIRVAMVEHGLMAPFSVEEEALPEIDEEMRAEQTVEGFYVPEGAVADDYWAAQQRSRDGDDTTITREQWEYAASCGIKLSALAGETFAKELFRNNHKRWKKA